MSRVIARYPFLRSAGEYLRLLDYSLDEFNDPSMSHIIDKASKRVLAAINGTVYSELSDEDVEVVSFLLACILVRSIGVKSLYRRFALYEARRAEGFLLEDLKRDRSAIENILTLVFKDVFAVDVKYIQGEGRFIMKVEDYLRYSTSFHDSYWRLTNRVVHRGYVYLDAKDVIRLVRDELVHLIMKRIEGMRLDISSLPEPILRRSEGLKSMLVEDKEFRVERLEVKSYPPCILNVLRTLEQGGNPSHTARVLLATYMLGIGKSVDQVCELFRSAPDYNERVTRYQVEHLAGLRGNRVAYSCPSCEKVMLQGLCFKDEGCDGIKNPVQFKGRKSDEDKD